MLQKVIQVGNSLAVVLPKSFAAEAGFKAGDEVVVDTNVMLRAAYVRPKKAARGAGLTPEFKQWLDEVAKKEADVIKALAKA